MAPTDLVGFTVAVTADRRRDEQTVLLERLGAQVLMFPLLRTEPADLGALRALTETVANEMCIRDRVRSAMAARASGRAGAATPGLVVAYLGLGSSHPAGPGEGTPLQRHP